MQAFATGSLFALGCLPQLNSEKGDAYTFKYPACHFFADNLGEW